MPKPERLVCDHDIMKIRKAAADSTREDMTIPESTREAMANFFEDDTLFTSLVDVEKLKRVIFETDDPDEIIVRLETECMRSNEDARAIIRARLAGAVN